MNGRSRDVATLVAELSGLNEEETEFVKNYLTDLGENSGRAGNSNSTITESDQISTD